MKGGKKSKSFTYFLNEIKNDQKIKLITIYQHYFINGLDVAGTQITVSDTQKV